MTKEEHREYMRKWRNEHPGYMRKYKSEHHEDWNECRRKYQSRDLNCSGKTKNSIRTRSLRYLFSNHSKLEWYEIHHCFGYEDYRKFIYIPKTLHQEIHKQLRENNISADSDHWMAIRDLVNSTDKYTYISV